MSSSHSWFKYLTADGTNDRRYSIFVFLEKANLLTDGNSWNGEKRTLRVCHDGLSPPNTPNPIDLADISMIYPNDLSARFNNSLFLWTKLRLPNQQVIANLSVDSAILSHQKSFSKGGDPAVLLFTWLQSDFFVTEINTTDAETLSISF